MTERSVYVFRLDCQMTIIPSKKPFKILITRELRTLKIYPVKSEQLLTFG